MNKNVLPLLLIAFIFTHCKQNSKEEQSADNQENDVGYAPLQKIVEDSTYGQFFEQRDDTGTMVLYFENGITKIYNLNRSKQRFSPASTFKVPNALIALEEGAISSVDEYIKWDGKKRFYDKWNADQNLRSAMEFSCVWFYQELARRVGKEKYHARFKHLHDYGNAPELILSDKVDEFWLDGSLLISAEEQILFLYWLMSRALEYKTETMESVEEIMLRDSTESYKLYAKTGWSMRVDEKVGWYVGYIKNKTKGNAVFALNINLASMNKAKDRLDIVYDVLGAEGYLE